MNAVPATAAALGLEPHPEGGWYRQYYVSPVTVPHPQARTDRSTATVIHYLLQPGERSRWHTVASDEIWLWQRGGALTLATAGPGPAPQDVRQHSLGPDISGGSSLHVLVPAGHWQCAEPAGDTEVLVSCLVTPGFDFADFHLLAGDGPTA